MNLLAAVHETLEAVGIPHAVIGAAAMAVHGVARSTLDLDLLAMDRRCLDASLWRELVERGVSVEIRVGDADDPLAGVVRMEATDARPVDLLVGLSGWQRDVLSRAQPSLVSSVDLPVASAADLVLLKLYAGGPQDRWDIEQLLSGADAAAIEAEVERHLSELPAECMLAWRQLRGA